MGELPYQKQRAAVASRLDTNTELFFETVAACVFFFAFLWTAMPVVKRSTTYIVGLRPSSHVEDWDMPMQGGKERVDLYGRGSS